jgi:ankyrin repeat protein
LFVTETEQGVFRLSPLGDCVLLIELGADVNKVDSVGATPLLHAVSVDFGDVEMVRVLLAAGASPAPLAKAIASAEELAERYGHRDFLPLLKRH